MSNLILPKKSQIWTPDRQLVLPDRKIIPPHPEFMGAAVNSKKRGKSAGGGGGGSDAEPTDPGGPNSNYLWKNSFDFNGTSVTFDDTSYPTIFINSSHSADFSLIAGRTGGKALRATIRSGSQLDYPVWTPHVQGHSWGLGSANLVGAGYASYPARSKCVSQFWFRTSSGGSPKPTGFKFAEFWEQGGGWRAEFSPVSTGSAGTEKWYLSVTNTLDVPVQFQPPYYYNVNDGLWHRFTALWKPNTTTGFTSATTTPTTSSRDGIARAWVDGTLIIDVQQSAIAQGRCDQDAVDNLLNYDIDYLKLIDVFNDCDNQHTLDLDDLLVWVAA